MLCNVCDTRPCWTPFDVCDECFRCAYPHTTDADIRLLPDDTAHMPAKAS